MSCLANRFARISGKAHPENRRHQTMDQSVSRRMDRWAARRMGQLAARRTDRSVATCQRVHTDLRGSKTRSETFEAMSLATHSNSSRILDRSSLRFLSIVTQSGTLQLVAEIERHPTLELEPSD